jgi:hypothetical protein
MSSPQETETVGDPWTRFSVRNRPKRLVGDIFLSAFLTSGFTIVIWNLMGSVQGAGLWILLLTGVGSLAPVLTIGIPAAIAIFGIVTARVGFVVGPTLAVAVFFFAIGHFNQRDKQAITAFATQELAPATRMHNVLAMDGYVQCDLVCIRILATSSLVLAGWNQSSNSWIVFRRGEGDACLTDDRLHSTLQFLEAGHRGMCALRTTTTELQDALVIRDRLSSAKAVVAGLPPSFRGSAVELSERIGGEERLLGRRVIGWVRWRWVQWRVPDAVAVFVFGPSAEERIDVGPKIDAKEFFAAAVGSSSAALSAQSSSSPAAILDEVEGYFDRLNVSDLATPLARSAASAWGRIASAQATAHPDIVVPRIRRLLMSADPARISIALTALFGVPATERAFAQDRMIELAFSPIIGLTDTPVIGLTVSPVIGPLNQHLAASAEPFPPEIRAQARARFVSEATFTIGQRQALFILMVRGGREQRHEAMDTLFSLNGIPFEEAVWAVARGMDIWTRNAPPRWTPEEVERLIGRMAGVPNGRLRRYLDAFRMGISTEQKDALVAHIRQRLRAAEAAPTPDDAEIQRLKLMIEAIPKNLSF